jgi:lipoprotein NlpD
MILNKSILQLIGLTLIVIFLTGCRASGNRRAPIEDRSNEGRQSVVEEKESATKKSQTNSRKYTLEAGIKSYVVQKGDTLYSIAFEHGLDYREVAEQNNIDNPAAIQIGQQIKLLSGEDTGNINNQIAVKPVVISPPVIIRKDQPKIIKLPYSEQAVLQIEKMMQDTGPAVPRETIPKNVTSTLPVKPEQDAESGSDDSLEWGMPTKGKVIAEYSESENRKGVDFIGSKGQTVVASAAGKVVYSGSGLRGYGKLVIIKHNKTYLSAYAHNEQILVKEGQNVTKGQKIAEMGDTDADQVKLHFEIRKFGKPIDPARFLNLTKS